MRNDLILKSEIHAFCLDKIKNIIILVEHFKNT